MTIQLLSPTTKELHGLVEFVLQKVISIFLNSMVFIYGPTLALLFHGKPLLNSMTNIVSIK